MIIPRRLNVSLLRLSDKIRYFIADFCAGLTIIELDVINNTPTTEECVWAVLSHLSAIALGKDFHYPIMGKRLAQYLGPKANDEWLNEDHEDRWVAAMGHFSVIIALWGMLAPLSAWILQGKRSLFLKFQSIQTLVYQVFVTLLFFGGIFVYIVGAFVLLSVVGLNRSTSINTSTGMTGLIIFLVFMLVFLAIILIVPLFHIMGQWAGYRVLKGDNYHYPLLGNLVEKWMLKLGSEENLK